MNVPHDLHAESVVLGCLLIDGAAAMEYCLSLRAEMFFLDSNQRIFIALHRLIEAGTRPDDLVLADALRGRGELDAVGGMVYIVGLTANVPRHYNPSGAVKIIIRRWQQRRGMAICDRYLASLRESHEPTETLAEMSTDVETVLQEKAQHDNPLVIAYTTNILSEFLSPTEARGLPYGIDCLDVNTDPEKVATAGMKRGRVTVVGARSGVGKTAAVCQAIAANCPGENGMPFDFFSLEAKRDEVLHRLWAVEARVPYWKIERKACDRFERKAVSDAALRVAEWPLRIYDDAALTLSQIASMARLSARRNGMKVFAVDYAQIVPAEGRDDKTRVSNVSRTLTALTKAEDVHLLLLSQLKKPERNEGYSKPPHIGDLRETGQLENDAHTVLLLHRPWDDEAGKIALDGEIIIAKQRQGATRTLPVRFDTNYLHFEGRTA